MSGRFLPASPLRPAGAPVPGVNSVTVERRLCGALVASFSLHVALAFLPYLGGNSLPASAPRVAPAAASPLPRMLEVRLVAQPVDQEEAPQPPKPTHGADVLPTPAPAYYTTDQLTMRPRPTAQPWLGVPKDIARFVNGKVRLKIWINELGNVDLVEVEKSDLPAAVSDTTKAAFAKLRFVPGEINGRRVGVLMRIEIAYVDGRTAPP